MSEEKGILDCLMLKGQEKWSMFIVISFSVGFIIFLTLRTLMNVSLTIFEAVFWIILIASIVIPIKYASACEKQK
ncbi:MAG TPA: hypothetical protein VGB37_08060, partial [Candidatus Lokiarchaeia archaeon]